jgi:hypothetical protein
MATESLRPEYPTVIYRGWDNTGLHPGVTLSWLNEIGQWFIFKEFWGDDVGAAEMAETVITWCNLHLAVGCEFEDYGDPAGKNRDGTKMSNKDYIALKSNEMGCYINIIDGIQSWKPRRESVSAKLRGLRNGKPAIMIDPIDCPLTIEGFGGGYAYRELAGMPGHFVEEAIKNKYADIHDSIQYMATRMFTTGNAVGGSERFGDHYSDEDDESPYQDMTFTGRNQITGY